MERSSTIAELMERRRIQAGAKEYQGHTYMDLARFDEATKHMIIFDVLTNESPVGWKGERNRLYLSEAGYQKALDNQNQDYQSCQCCQRKSVLRPQRYGTMIFTLLLAGGDDSCRKKLKTGR